MNMNKEPDFFSNITPVNGGLIIIALGTLLLIGAIRRWKWIFDMTGQRDKGFNFLLLLYDLFGDKGLRVGMIITSIIFILGGIGMMVFM
ncbi:Imm17 family immunity protein [Bacteroides congonensis]|uniref:Imm17 family immunity protein n=2 Tax=Bacteroides TaxID=816 RepID=UPI001E445AC4|nr:Imm17 family immunity protein [Bacteroides congonensis]